MACRFFIWFSLLLLLESPLLGQAQVAPSPAPVPRTWFVQAGGSGNGLDPSSPFGTSEQVESASGPGDIIILLPATAPLAGGLALKPQQVLRGVLDGSRRPVITNTSGDRKGGVGLVLADGVWIDGVEIRDTHASGILGVDVDDVRVANLLVQNANRGRLIVDGAPFPFPLPHAGITLMTAREGVSTNVELSGVHVLEAAGVGVAAVASAGSEIALHLLDAEVRGGEEIGAVDYGVMAFATGPSSGVSLEMTGSHVSGRMSPVGRNVVLAAADHGRARGLLSESIVGASGQDGVIATTVALPANVDLMIVGSTIENAAQSNVEGTMNAYPHEEADALASQVAISIHRSTIRGAGTLPGFENRAANVNLTGSFVPTGQPLPHGRYVLHLTDSEVESSHTFGLRVGTPDFQATVDPGDYDILVRGTRFEGNGLADVMIGASNARVDARGNCWPSRDGREGPRVRTYWGQAATVVDASQPTPCTRSPLPSR